MNNNIFTTIQSYDPSDPENLKVQKLEKNKEQEEFINFKNLLLSSEWLIQAFLFQLLEDKIGKILGIKKNANTLSNEELITLLQTMKTLFNRLKTENLSESSPFARELSDCWHSLLHMGDYKTPSLKKGTSLEKIEFLFTMIRSYPEGGDHSLGYYLSKYTGDKWLPFPFMELLKNLHEDAIIQKEKSFLDKWTVTLTDIINSLQS